ncbi:cytohesin-interacting [Pelobates cultripes]|uniref:Cytohesin-interacting n=1 Tax=Pelobates cultripes TaxID=61616 RepID=A0AAD1SS57_PELCU|nr:cytohesin-interacting [Pelobates cultripes]
MSSKRHNKKQEVCESIEENVVLSNYAGSSQGLCSRDFDRKSSHSLASILATLPRSHRHVSMSRSNSLIESSGTGPHRRLLVIVKQDNEAFGFEIQTYKLQHQNAYALEMCTYVCKVHDNSPSSCAGLKKGDMLANINGISTEGFTHQQTVDLIRSSGNYLRIETVNGIKIRRTELEARLMFLKHEFNEKWGELQTLSRKEQQLIYGTVNEARVEEQLESLRLELFPSHAQSPKSFLNKHRFSSGSSYASHLSLMTDCSEDGFGQTSVFDEDSGSEAFSRQSSIDDDYSSVKSNAHSSKKSTLLRHRTISMASSESESQSPGWDTIRLSNFFGTLPRKSRRGSVRKNFLKFIPGLHRSVEEEGSPV